MISETARPKDGSPDSPLSSPVQYLRGVGPKFSRLFSRLGIENIADLLTYFPRRHEDRSNLSPISSLMPGTSSTVKGIIEKVREWRAKSGILLTQFKISDFTANLELTFFNNPYLKRQFKPGDQVFIYGKVESGPPFKMASPELEPVTQNDPVNAGRIVPVYPLTEGLSQRYLRKLIYQTLKLYLPKIPEIFPPKFLAVYKLMGYAEALEAFHFPRDFDQYSQARRRLAFEELLLFQLWLGLEKLILGKRERKHRYRLDTQVLRSLVESLPFKLTSAQRRVLREIYRDLSSPHLMNRLLHGDVGCGKTVVAAFAVFLAAFSGCQAAVMAPTEILARQHFQKFSEFLSPFGIEVEILLGEPRSKRKQKLLERLKSGDLKVVVGTHALIQPEVEFKDLALVVIDEQHKFGVAQRSAIKEKGEKADLLIMTATPIPRTLALTLYGDLDLSVIDELPPGRIKVKTYVVDSGLRDRIYDFVRKHACAGKQTFIVCPVIEESDLKQLKSALKEAENLQKVIFPDLKVSLLHGRMKNQEKDLIMEDFRTGKFQVLIATTVIEVGVDIPQAVLLVVENAERFGLSQLHQLRGRVGRASEQAFAVFISDSENPESRERLKVLEKFQDGFKIAEEDLKMRGPGEFLGSRQHGVSDLKVANLVSDVKLLEAARELAGKLIKSGEIEKPEYQLLKNKAEESFGQKEIEKH